MKIITWCTSVMPQPRPVIFWKPSSVSIEKAGGSMDDVNVSIMSLSKTGQIMRAINTVYAEYFPGDKPARYCVQTGLVKPDALVEIASIAHV